MPVDSPSKGHHRLQEGAPRRLDYKIVVANEPVGCILQWRRMPKRKPWLKRCMVSFVVFDSLLRSREQPFPKIHYRKQSFATISQSSGNAFCHTPSLDPACLCNSLEMRDLSLKASRVKLAFKVR